MRSLLIAGVLLALTVGVRLLAARAQDPGITFRSGVEMIDVTATVTDERGHFVSGLTRDDFRLFEDGRPQEIAHFSAERVPVSVGIAIDTSGSMEGEKWSAARRALDRFLFELLGAEDEVFVYRFSDVPELVEGWTKDRGRVSAALTRIRPRGGTALFDTVAEAVPMAQSGRHRKKALVIISDGNDTSSTRGPRELQQVVRGTEVLVYAIGIDGRAEAPVWSPFPRPNPPGRTPPTFPFPIPGRRLPRPGYPPYPPYPQTPPYGGGRYGRTGDERVNVGALRALTDDSGGRTEVIRDARDLGPATAGIAAELSRQYYLAYAAAGPRDGRWRTIDVQVAGERGYHVRHRRGYVATQ
jgi:VWFA-related protein